MAHTSRVIVICVALVFGACGKQQPVHKETPAPTPTSSAAALQPNTFHGVGVVKGLNLKVPAIEIDHEEIVGLMQGMQMEFPVTDGTLLSGLAVNDHIDFTIVEKNGEMKVTEIKKK